MPPTSQSLQYRPVTLERLADLRCFSEQHGKFRYCSCMRWRIRSSQFGGSTKGERVAALNRLVHDHNPVGVLAYASGQPVGWCSIAPRESYEALERYRALPRIDDRPVWSVVCFFVASKFRRKGATLGLLSAAVTYARSHGAEIIEGYPVEPARGLYTYMGSPATFRAAGFHEVTPPGQARAVMRYFVGKGLGSTKGSHRGRR
jgi:GNAT superfamily N-acetyltransferase